MTQPISTQFFSLEYLHDRLEDCHEWIDSHSISSLAVPIIVLAGCYFVQTVSLITGMVTWFTGAVICLAMMRHENQNNAMREEIDQLRRDLSEIPIVEENNDLTARELRAYVYEDFQTVQDNFMRLQRMLSERLPHAFMSFTRIMGEEDSESFEDTLIGLHRATTNGELNLLSEYRL